MTLFDKLAWIGVIALIFKIKEETCAGNGFHDFSLTNPIIESERNYVVQAAVRFYKMEIEQPAFESIVRYYLNIVSIESGKVWDADFQVRSYNARIADGLKPVDKYVFLADDDLPTREIDFLDNQFASWTYKDSLPDKMSLTFGTKFMDWNR